MPRSALILALSTLLATAAAASPADHAARIDPRVDPATLVAPTVRVVGAASVSHHPRVIDGARVVDQDLVIVAGPTGERAFGHLAPVTAPMALLDASAAEAAARSRWPGAIVSPLEALLVPTDAGGATHRPVWVGLVQPTQGLPQVARIDATTAEIVAVPAAFDAVARVSTYAHNPLHGDVVEGSVQIDEPELLWTEDLVVRQETSTDLLTSTGDYVYASDDPRFSVTSAYFHLQDAVAWMNAAVPGDGITATTVAVVNIGEDNDYGEPSMATNAFHLWFEEGDFVGHVLLMGGGARIGGFTVENTAHSADVLIHEMGHGLVDEVTPFHPWDHMGEDEYRALHEGLADYAAAARLDYPVIADHVFGDLGARDLREGRRYPEDFAIEAGQHENGRIIGSMGWALRSVIGAPADTIVLGAPAYLSAGSPDYDGLAAGLLAVNSDSFEGRYLAPLLAAMEAHGLRIDAEGDRPAAVPAFEHRRVQRNKATTVSVEMSDPDGDALRSVHWELAVVPDGSEVTLDGEARFEHTVSITPDVCGDYALRVQVADAGDRSSRWQYVTIAACPAGCASSVAGPEATPSMALLLLAAGVPWILRRRR